MLVLGNKSAGKAEKLVCMQDTLKTRSEEERKKDEELDRQVLLAEQRREEERLVQEERQREKLEKIKAVEGKVDT